MSLRKLSKSKSLNIKIYFLFTNLYSYFKAMRMQFWAQLIPWFMRYNSGISKNEYGNAIALDDFGNVFTSGWSNARDVEDFVVIKYAQSNIFENNIQLSSLDNFPNPFNPSTKISFNLDHSSFIKLIIYDVRGREIFVLANEYINPGKHAYTFNADNLNSGVYFYKLEAEGNDGNKFFMTKKMILVK